MTHDKPRAKQLSGEKVIANRKTFFIDTMQNDKGRFVKLTEDVRGRRDTIMIPEEALADVIDALVSSGETMGIYEPE